MIEIVERTPTTQEYAALRGAVGWKVPPPDQCETALHATVAGVVAHVGGETVAMGRLVGDGVFYSFVVDLVVRPDHQRGGIGSRVLAALERTTAARSTTGLIQLVADEPLLPFYERNGFERGDDDLYSKRLAPYAGSSTGIAVAPRALGGDGDNEGTSPG
jgi:GNAT superfamily N-acetyltransferase